MVQDPRAEEPGQGTYFLGRYRVVDEIGIGGMASVHLARMDGPGGFQKWVAIKRIHAHLIEDESFVQMFLDEARVAARISHPNVASVIELGKHQDSYWIAMEYLHGEPLREVMRRTEELGAPMPPEIACRIIADAAEGLHAAHELSGKDGEKMDLVHRDVTPHNLFVTYDGSTKVVDFGIAKFLNRMSNTRHGTLKGKIAYMSPEQVYGEQIDRRTDLFALGVVLWELTTGKRLFRMESDLDTLAKVQECNVPKPSTIVRGYPLDLEKIVLKALAKKRDDRFRTARELARALQGLLMRRGLFVERDEVASYMRSIFSERIQKRDAHLRWAAEVTQTINLDIGGAAAKAETQSALLVVPEPATGNDRPAVPRPAAGVPAGPVPTKPTRAALPAPPGGGKPHTGTSQATTNARQSGKPAEDSGVSDPYYEDGPTLMDDAPSPSAGSPSEEEDYDDTIITTTRVENQASSPQKPLLPAAGRPAAAPGEESQEPTRPKPSDAYAPIAYDTTRAAPEDMAPIVAVTGPQLGVSGPSPTTAPVPTTPFAAAPHTIGPAGPQMLLPTVPRVLPPARVPALPRWAVGVGSGVIALLALFIISILLAHTSSRAPVMPPGPAVGGGPFGAARNSFQTAIAPRPLGAVTPAIAPTDSPAPSAAAPTAASAVSTTRAIVPGRGGRSAPAAAASPTGLISVFCRRGGKGIDCDEVLDNGLTLGAKIQRVALPVGEHRITVRTKSPASERVFTRFIKVDELETIRADME